jgi:membrane protease YdiL (CAAX protease family)
LTRLNYRAWYKGSYMKNWLLLVVYSSSFVSSAIAIESDPVRPESSFEPSFNMQPPISYASPEQIYKSPYKNAALAAGLSALFPGLGHVYIGDMKTAGCLAGGTGLAMSAAAIASETDDAIYVSGAYTAQNTWAYGIYAAYRDARKMNGSSGYSYKMPKDSLSDLVAAPFNLKILKKPEVWGGVLGALTAAVGVGFLYNYTSSHTTPPSLSARGNNVMPLMALPVGIGEEALFRGYLQPQLSEVFNPTAGIALSSLAFGAVHLINTQGMTKYERNKYCTISIPFITCFGAYFGWLAHKNSSLKESVAVHTLYDFVLFSIGALADNLNFGFLYESQRVLKAA